MVDVNKLAARRVLPGSPPDWISRRETRWGWGGFVAVRVLGKFGRLKKRVRLVCERTLPARARLTGGRSVWHLRAIVRHCPPRTKSRRDDFIRFLFRFLSGYAAVRGTGHALHRDGRWSIRLVVSPSRPIARCTGSRCAAAAAVLDRSPARRWEMGDILKRKTDPVRSDVVPKGGREEPALWN